MDLKTNKKFFSLAVVGISIIVNLLLFVLVIVPHIINVKNNLAAIEEEAKKNEILTKKLQILYEADLKTLSQYFLLANLALMPNRNPARIFSYLDSLMQKVDSKKLSFDKISYVPGLVKKGEDLAAEKKMQTARSSGDLMLNFPIKGDVQTVIDFVKTMEENYPLVSVDNLDGRLINDTLNLSFNLVFFVFEDSRYLPAASIPLADFTPQETKFLNELSVIKDSQILTSEND